MTAEPVFADAAAPERTRLLDAAGVRLCLREWGDPDAPAVVLCHGMFDHARGFDALAPLLSERFRVVAVDARGHGDSSWADAYGWAADLLDIGMVLRDLGRPVHLVGHSKGGGQAADAAVLFPDAVRSVVNIDGFGPPADEGFPRPGRGPDPRSLPEQFGDFLDRRHAIGSGRGWRTYASLDELVARRLDQNPRLSRDWLRYFVFHGARQTERGWVWKADPLLGMGFGPFKPRWIGPGWIGLRAPMLALVGSEPDTWGPIPEPMRAERLRHVRQLDQAVVEEAGHFAHMEQPRRTADLLLGFLER